MIEIIKSDVDYGLPLDYSQDCIKNDKQNDDEEKTADKSNKQEIGTN